jgi:hypothetical protein
MRVGRALLRRRISPRSGGTERAPFLKEEVL